MHTDAQKFLLEIRKAPRFLAAVEHDPMLREHFEAIENGLRIIYAMGAADNAEAIELFDDIRSILRRKQRIKIRLL